jgi:hypothetical protein
LEVTYCHNQIVSDKFKRGSSPGNKADAACRGVQSKAPKTSPEHKQKDHTLAWKRSTPNIPLQQIRNLDGTHHSSFRKIAKSHRNGSRKRIKRENKSATPLPPPSVPTAATAQKASSQTTEKEEETNGGVERTST